MAIIASGEVLIEGSPAEALSSLEGRIWSKIVASDDELPALADAQLGKTRGRNVGKKGYVLEI